MKTTEWQKMIAVANLDPRGHDRDSAVFPVEVSGFDCFGRYFTERTFLVNANEARCRFQVRVQVPQHSVVAICFIRRNSQSLNSRPELFDVINARQITNGCQVEASRLLRESVLSIKTSERTYRNKQTP